MSSTIGTRSRAAGVIVRIFSTPRGAISTGYIVLLILVAVFAPLISPASPTHQGLDILQPMGTPGHLMGTDDLGRDVLARLIYGTSTSIAASFLALGVALLIGFPLGLAAGYFGGWVDAVLMRVVDTILSFPAIILALSITAVLGAGLTNSMIAIGIVFSPSIARLIRGQLLSVKGEVYVDASRSFGATGRHLVAQHLIPNSVQPVVVQSSLLLAAALIAEASLSFLGLGVQPPASSWGSMLARAYTFVGQAPLQMLAPGIAIAAAALAFNVFGDVIQSALDPRRRRQ